MIKLSVLYQGDSNATFDLDYYRGKHMDLVRARCGSAIKRIEVERGLTGASPGDPPVWKAAGHLYFDSLAAFQQSFVPHIQEIVADVPNFTTLQPTVQISELA